jgi:ketosteroid isomerase-like protein
MRLLLCSLLLWLAGCASAPRAVDLGDRVSELRASEEAFARSMAERKLSAFASYIADEAVFVNGGEPLRGKAAILAFWGQWFDGPEAPFSWEPEHAEVTLDGAFGYTEGPVRSPEGATVLRFHSTWRREPDGRWLILFDNGSRHCPTVPAQ